MKKNVLKYLVCIISFILISFIFSQVCLGQSREGTTPSPSSPQPVQLTNPLPTANIPTLLGTVINVVLGVTGSLALVMFIFGGLTWMTSAGNSERVSKGKNILIWATIGLVIIFSAYALVKFVFTSIGAPQ